LFCAGILLNLALSAPTAHAVTTHSGLEAALANAEADEGVGKTAVFSSSSSFN
jgi:hypothetical protein